MYCRISDDKEGTGLGVQRQEADCRELAEAHGFAVAHVYSDNDLSAFSGRKRPGYLAMLEALKAGKASRVYVWASDRLHRRPVELEEYIEVVRSGGIQTYMVKGGQVDLVSAEGILRAGMLGQIARYESQHKSDRIKRKQQEKALKGLWLGGTRPFGWKQSTDGWEVDEAEGEAVRMVCHGVIAGRSLGALVNELNDAGMTTSRAKPWGYSQLRQMIQRPRNAGLADYQGEIVGASEFPAIVSEDVWRAACSVLREPGRRRSQSNKAVHLLSGIAQCHCGELVRTASITGRSGEAYKIYRCPAKGRGHVGKRIEPVDAMVNRIMVAGLAYSKLKPVQEASTEELQSLASETAALRQRLTEAATMAASGAITLGQLATMTAHIEATLKASEARMEELGAQSHRLSAPGGWPDARMDSPAGLEWAAMDIDTRRDHVRSMLNIALFPHDNGSPRVFDPMTVLIRIKQLGDNRGPLTSEQIVQARKEDARGFFTAATPH
ncbi:recombinase family protein [Arthrobacter sp. NPDC058130]|uniref:recombinase family protein n=1 Tax=Arthrobacter sp. NPDC058130 TaxID=3346353 RepID=UPI0036E97975